jgi:hypothetical protein
MLNNRRRFIRTAGLIAGAAALSGLPLAASEPPAASVAEREVSAVIGRYGSCIGISRDAVRATEFKVKIHSARHFAKVFDPQHLPFERIYVGPENALKIKHGGAEFTIVNVG